MDVIESSGFDSQVLCNGTDHADNLIHELKKFSRQDGETIAYIARPCKHPSMIWMGGFTSDMSGIKATTLDRWFAKLNRAFMQFDYFGHGRSSGLFCCGTISRWREGSLVAIDRLTDRPQILIGSSIGGWLAILAVLARPERVAELLLIAPVVDFSEALLWQRLPEGSRQQILQKGEWYQPSPYDSEPYTITRSLIEDGQNIFSFIQRKNFLSGSYPPRYARYGRSLGARYEDNPSDQM